MLDDDLMARLRARAADPKLRKDAPDVEAMLRQSNVATIDTALGTIAMARGAPRPDQPTAPSKPLPNPASREDIAEAEARLGHALPEDLKQVYSEIANGGFGPGSGLVPLNDALGFYESLLADPPGELGQPWPTHLVPFNLYDLGCDCYDVISGEIVYWDEGSLAEGPDERVWSRSFKATADSLSAYFESWLGTPPPNNERFVSGPDVGLDDGAGTIDMFVIEHLQRSIEIMGSQSAEERSIWGLPEIGWEDALCEMNGIDPKVYRELAKRPSRDD